MPSKSKMIRYMKNYIYNSFVTNETGIIGTIKSKIWHAKLDKMSEGDVMDLYYTLSDKKEGDWFE